MEYLLQIKAGALVGLLFLTLIFGFIPARMKWFRESSGTETHRVVLSLISCFAGGVFLAACLLDVIPDYLSDISAELDLRRLDNDFPLAEFIMACGFFAVLIIERLVLSCTHQHGEESAPLLPPAGHGHGTHSVNSMESSGRHVHVDLQAHSSFRSFMLFLSLSLHSVFEGLAIGLQTTEAKVKALGRVSLPKHASDYGSDTARGYF